MLEVGNLNPSKFEANVNDGGDSTTLRRTLEKQVTTFFKVGSNKPTKAV